jgi:hypothetical protein
MSQIPATRTPQGALKFVALIIKILSCNKNFFLWSMIKITTIVLLYVAKDVNKPN